METGVALSSKIPLDLSLWLEGVEFLLEMVLDVGVEVVSGSAGTGSDSDCGSGSGLWMWSGSWRMRGISVGDGVEFVQ